MTRRHHSTAERESANVIHTTIRLSNSLRKRKDKPIDHKKTSFSLKSVTRHTRHHRNEFKTASIVPVVDENFIRKSSSIISIKTNQNDQYLSKIIDIQSDRTEPVSNYHQKSKLRNNRKYFGDYCCTCSPLCAILSLFAGLLLGIVIAALIVELLNKTEATTTTTTTTTVSTSTITSSTTSSTTSTSTTTQTTTLPILSIDTNDTLYGIWNTTAGGNTTLATPGLGVGNYVPAENPENAFDNNCSTKFTSFGECADNASLSSPTCGINTGLYITLNQGAVVLGGLRFCTGNDYPSRDSMTMTLEGSNQTGTTLMLGSSWNIIYNGSCGLDVDPGRETLGQTQTFSNNIIAYSSYRILITSKRASDYATQYSEVELFGY